MSDGCKPVKKNGMYKGLSVKSWLLISESHTTEF